MEVSIAAKTPPLLVEQPCDLLHPDSTGDLKICNKFNRGTESLAHDLVRGGYSPAKAGLIRGKLGNLYK